MIDIFLPELKIWYTGSSCPSRIRAEIMLSTYVCIRFHPFVQNGAPKYKYVDNFTLLKIMLIFLKMNALSILY